MKKSATVFFITLAFLLGGQAFSQVSILELAGGQGIFTPGQRTEMLARRAQLDNMDANVADYKANPTQYDFDHWHSEVGIRMNNATGGNVFQYSPIKNNGGYRDHFVDLAVSAWLDNDLTEAGLVVDYLVRHFNDDNLDVSNGQATNFTNPTHGTFERFYVQDEVNPWFEFNAWVKKCLQSWILINDIPGFSTSTANRNLINEYFAYAADWAYRTYLFRTGYRGINLVSQSFNANNGFNSFFNPNSKRTNPFLEDINGNPYNQYQVSQVMSLQNTAWDWIDVIDMYGIHYNVTLYKDWVKAAWDYYFVSIVYPNGINGEMYRGYDDRPNWGMFYTPVTLSSLVKIAHGHAAAVLNGVPGVSDVGYFYDRTVTEGLEDNAYFGSGYCCAPTGDGSPKGLELALVAHARFLAQGSPQSNATEWGHSSNGGNRFYNNGELIDGDNHYQFTNPFAVATCWYNNPILSRAYKRQSEFSHIPATGGQSMGAYRNDEGTLYKWGADVEVWRDMEAVMYGGTIANQAPVVSHPQGSLQNTSGNTRYYDVQVDVGGSFALQDANWTDNEDGSGTVTNNQIRRLSDNQTGVSISTASAETYEVRFQYTDAGGITATAFLYVIVNPIGNNCPTLVFSDASGDPQRQTIEWGQAWVRPTVIAQDVEDGNTTINILETNVNHNGQIINGVVSDEQTEVGEYIVRFSFTDLDGCTVEEDYIVEVVPSIICATSLTPEAGPINIIVGETRTLNPTILPANRTTQAFGVSSSNDAIVRVDLNGNIVGVSPGTVQVRQFTFDCGPEEEGFTTVNVIDLNQLAAQVPYFIYIKKIE